MDKKPGQSLNNNREDRSPSNPQVSRGNLNNRQPGVSNQLPNQGGQMRQSRENNNVNADRDGSVYPKNNKGNWSQHDNRNNSWSTPTNNASVSNLDRESQSRDRGNMRTNNYSQLRSTSGGRSFGGGGRRR